MSDRTQHDLYDLSVAELYDLLESVQAARDAEDASRRQRFDNAAAAVSISFELLRRKQLPEDTR